MIPTQPAPETVDYDTYFSKVDGKEILEHYGKRYLENTSVPFADYWVEIDSGTGCPALISSKNGELVKVLYEDQATGISGSDRFAVAIVEDGTKFIKLGYNGEEPELLYTVPDGRIKERMLEVYQECVFFIASVDEEHDGIYRLYVPDGTVDLLVDNLPRGVKEYHFTVVSNCEIVWRVDDDIIALYGEEYWEKPCLGEEKLTPKEFYRNYYGDNETYEDMLENRSALEDYAWKLQYEAYPEGEFPRTNYYLNTLTGEIRIIYSDIYYNNRSAMMYPDGSYRDNDLNIQDDNGLWFMDDYYIA
ncbi:MAG TPA: hypothetical protein IAC31_06145 [Candidatus Faecousia intestinigallinarum]|nr:hypothetical protein [Candidatus Faecousia intestinigallinarum]